MIVPDSAHGIIGRLEGDSLYRGLIYVLDETPSGHRNPRLAQSTKEGFATAEAAMAYCVHVIPHLFSVPAREQKEGNQ